MLAVGCFLEMFGNAPLALCESRDVKGLYRRARANKITDFTVISFVHKPPEAPELEVRTDLLTVEASVALVFDAVKTRLSSLSKYGPSTRRETPSEQKIFG
jgi:adenylylsulfate kinase